MLKNEDIICISSIDWDFIWQGHQEIMTRLARTGNRVLFIENTGVRMPGIRDFKRIKNRILNWRKGVHGVRKIEEGLYVYSPLVFPFPYWKIARFINKRLMFSVLMKWLKAVGFSEPVVWTFLPTGLSLDLIEELQPKVLIYYCIDSFQASSKDAEKIKQTEGLMLKKADLVFATSQELFDYCAETSKNVHYFPFAVNIDNFTGILDKTDTAPGDMADIKRPIAGYVGGVHKWIDFDLVREIALKNKDVSFVFCGPVQADVAKIKDLANVTLLGQKDTGELPAYVREFDVTLIPYRITEYTKNVYPTKLNEYLSLGKPVISTGLPEIMKFNRENRGIVRVASTADDFSENIKSILEKPLREEERTQAMDAAKRNSWSARLKNMSSLIEETGRRKAAEKEKTWRDNLSRFYKKSRKRLVLAVLIVLLGYTVVFRTPLAWVAARPLALESAPVKSDIIAVLGGGVGESGKVGQGYEERVDTAVKLYADAMGGKIVFISGYRYIMKEAEVMKALSVSMGVKESDIITEDSPVNTYEMIKLLGNLARKNGWESIILISSPYHMLRLRGLCDKYLAGKNIYFVPPGKCSFFENKNGIRPAQLKAIIHEYMAILYYRLKGYA